MEFKDRLKEARKMQGLTQEQLAKRCNRSTAWVGVYECGLRVPTVPSIKILMKALRCDANYLLT